MKNQEITICEISTFAFMGAEYWCPFCGNTVGIFGGENVPLTPELKNEAKVWKAKSKLFLQAYSRKTCQSFLFKGKRITYAELPESEKFVETVKEFFAQTEHPYKPTPDMQDYPTNYV